MGLDKQPTEQGKKMSATTHSTARHKLHVTMPTDTEVRMERMFDAPRQLVWDAFTKAEMLEKWWGLRSTTTKVEKLEVRVGGKYRFLQTDPTGTVHAFRGEFTTVSPIDALGYTFEYEPMAGHIVQDDVTFEDHGRQTKIVAVMTFTSKMDRDGMVNSGMEYGAAESYDMLDELLAELGASVI